MSLNKFIIHEIDGEDGLYSIHLEGPFSSDVDIDVESDFLSAEDAHEIALGYSSEYELDIVWEGSKPGWI